MSDSAESVMPPEKKGQWFIVHALSGHENKVRDTILRQLQISDSMPVYEAVIPTKKVPDVRQGKKTIKTTKIFPGYVLVRMDLYGEDGVIDEKAWYFIRNVQGVLGFLGAANRPSALSDFEVDNIIGKSEEEVAPVFTSPVVIGDVVRIKEGPFENFEGVVQEIDTERGKLKVMVSIFGRSTPVELEFWQVERADEK